MLEQLSEAKEFLLSRVGEFPRTVLVLGSGMSNVLSSLKVELEIPYGDIPNVPEVAVEGHSGCLKVGRLGDRRVAACQGRLHYYEGHSIQTVVFPFRAMALAGAEVFILTNAAGGLRAEMKPMSLMLISDHINLMGTNPLMGPHLPELGPRFPDLTQLYNPQLRSLFRKIAERERIELFEGVYVALHGPSYETPSEIRMYRQLGGDAVGMSTVPEAIALHQMGKRVVALSCITNSAAGVTGAPLNHKEVLENAKHTHVSLAKLFEQVLLELPDYE